MPDRRRLLLAFGALSLFTVLAGAYVAAVNDVAVGVWSRNIAAWCVGAVLAVMMASSYRPVFLTIALCALPAGLLATFVSPDQDGVHRWVDLPFLHINMAMLLLPAASVAMTICSQARLWPCLVALLCAGLLAAQPDASQTTAICAVLGLVAVVAVKPVGMRIAILAAAMAVAVVSWSQPDPLRPVPEVEEMFFLAFSLSPLAGALVGIALAATVAAPAMILTPASPYVRFAGWSLTTCLAVWSVMPLLGAFPVPLAGMGMSPIVGAWLGLGLLAGAAGPAKLAA